ncbi:hypothetical protein HUG17_2949 [Dermatophagoides farinae]|uniref:Uncharacterized protein n=1 Tax=Dermatophagoides farinae TaxID=6954 RepID=A0A9D4SEN3_DERFA|nr:hypothetical protein HUG17_2949 [Dermatophagoides farinae]
MYLQRKFIMLGHGFIPPRELTAECSKDKSLHKFYYSPVEDLIRTHLLLDELLSNIMNERPEDVSPYILESNMLNSLRLIFTKYKTKSEDFPGLWVEIAKMKIALLLANLNTIKATSIRQILSPLVSDLKRLEDRGLFIRERGITIKVRLAFVIGDNLGVSELLGFKQNFSTHFVCRFCGATYREYKDHSVISKPLNIHTM